MEAQTEPAVKVLIVDDRPENLLAVEAALEPLHLHTIRANSGNEALKQLLIHDFAVILLDVQMPGIDGFETAQLIKERERTRNIPIIFLTAISKEESHVFAGYEVGAIDYIFKPLDPNVLRSKVRVLVELYTAGRRIREQDRLLREGEQRERDREVAMVRRSGEERYRKLAEALPQIVWSTTAAGEVDYYNERFYGYSGLTADQALGSGWKKIVASDDLAMMDEAWRETVASGDIYEGEVRFRRFDGVYRWHLVRAVPTRDPQGAITGWVGTSTDIHERKRTEEVQAFLSMATGVLSSTLQVGQTLGEVSSLAAMTMADWCGVFLVEKDGSVSRNCYGHSARIKARAAHRFAAVAKGKAPSAVQHVIERNRPTLLPRVDQAMIAAWTRDDAHAQTWRELGVGSILCVPLCIREETLGAVVLASCDNEQLGKEDLFWAEELASRVAAALDAARLYEQAEARARAAQVLETVADGVFLVDKSGVIGLWNPAAEAITGLPESEVLGKRAEKAIPGWRQAADRIPVMPSQRQEGYEAETVPLDVRGRELWISIAGVGFSGGTVYAFRDLTESRTVDKMKSDFIATVSHELRTPLAAIYGAAATIRRTDLALDEQTREQLLAMISDQSERLAEIVSDVLLASRLDVGQAQVSVEPVEVGKICADVVAAAEMHRPENIQLCYTMPSEPVIISADAGHLRQVLGNLVENAVKYSPDGGSVTVAVERKDANVHLSVSDQGIGIPPRERTKIFDKFYRLDPGMSRGIGGTGLGLYITRELVRQMDGRVWVAPNSEFGTRFIVELPMAEIPAPAPVPVSAAPVSAAPVSAAPVSAAPVSAAPSAVVAPNGTKSDSSNRATKPKKAKKPAPAKTKAPARRA